MNETPTKEKTMMDSNTIKELKNALATGNPWDLYDAIADNGFESDELRKGSDDPRFLSGYVAGLLFGL